MLHSVSVFISKPYENTLNLRLSLSFGQKRRSNRVVKRKKYTEDLDIKITDDEDEQEDVDVTTTAAAVASISGGTAALLKQEMELDVDGQPSMQFFVVSVELF